MPKRLTSETRRYLGEPIGSELAAWMNKERDLASRMWARWREDFDVGLAVVLPAGLQATRPVGLVISETQPWPTMTSPLTRASPAAVKRIGELIKILQEEVPEDDRARVHRAVRLSSYELKFSLTFIFHAGRLVPVYLLPSRNAEGPAIWHVLQLLHQGLLHRLRRCAWCKHWLFAHFNSQLFCSAKCRKTHRERSEEYKAYRRKKAKQYYERKAHAKKR